MGSGLPHAARCFARGVAVRPGTCSLSLPRPVTGDERNTDRGGHPQAWRRDTGSYNWLKSARRRGRVGGSIGRCSPVLLACRDCHSALRQRYRAPGLQLVLLLRSGRSGADWVPLASRRRPQSGSGGCWSHSGLGGRPGLALATGRPARASPSAGCSMSDRPRRAPWHPHLATRGGRGLSDSCRGCLSNASALSASPSRENRDALLHPGQLPPQDFVHGACGQLQLRARGARPRRSCHNGAQGRQSTPQPTKAAAVQQGLTTPGRSEQPSRCEMAAAAAAGPPVRRAPPSLQTRWSRILAGTARGTLAGRNCRRDQWPAAQPIARPTPKFVTPLPLAGACAPCRSLGAFSEGRALGQALTWGPAPARLCLPRTQCKPL